MHVAGSRRPRGLTPMFYRKMRGGVAWLVLVSVVSFGVIEQRRVHRQRQRALKDLARACTAALVPGPGGDLAESADRLRHRFPQLLAVATLDGAGLLNQVHPERPAHRAMVQAVMASPASETTVSVSDRAGQVRVRGVELPLQGPPHSAARRVLVLLRTDGAGAAWVRPTLLFALILVVVAWLLIRSLNRWFVHSVAHPLRTIARAVGEPASPQATVALTGGWPCRETAHLAEAITALLRDVQSIEARAARVERESRSRIRRRQRSFDRELRRARDRATIDPLTRLRNRAYLADRLEPLCEHQRREPGELCVAMLDIDNFKAFNDARGHPAGDGLLRFVGLLLRGTLRAEDVAVRYGGDEFVLLLPNTTLADARTVMERVVKLFDQYTRGVARAARPSLSAGVASLQPHGTRTGHDLIAAADAALYAAKRNGKNTVVAHQAA